MYQNPRPNGASAKPVPPDLRSKFNLAPQPASVTKIAGLVKGRASASMDEIGQIIDGNTGVTQKLISMAYPKQAARLGATVQMATSRLGVNRVIVVMVGDLLSKAVIETFTTMIDMPLEVTETPAASITDYGYLTGTVRFNGENSGQVTLAFSPHMSLVITAKAMGGELGSEEHTPEVINDAIGELVNIVTGSLQSKLSDAGLSSEVGLPQVQYSASLPKEAVPGGSSDLYYFKCGAHTLVAHLSIDPSAPKGAIAPPGPRRAPPTHGTTWRANGA
jgi:CheY-specific phosphatase CheX